MVIWVAMDLIDAKDVKCKMQEPDTSSISSLSYLAPSTAERFTNTEVHYPRTPGE